MFGFGQRTHIWLGVCSLPPCCVQWGRRGEGQCVLLRREGGLRVREWWQYWLGIGQISSGRRREASQYCDQTRPQGGATTQPWTHATCKEKFNQQISSSIQPKVHSIPLDLTSDVFPRTYCTPFEVINATLLTFHAHFHLAREDS